jgi:hypothetical protein
LIIAAHQAATRLFWEEERHKYDLYISPFVLDECSLGDPAAAQKQLDFIAGIALLPKTEQTAELADAYQILLNVPPRAKTDCSHLAVCVCSEMDFLVSWNCNHLGLDAYIKVRAYNEKHALWTPLLVIPEYFISAEREDANALV